MWLFEPTERYSKFAKDKDMKTKGRGGGQEVSILAFKFVDSSSNPAEVFNFYCVPKNNLNRKKIIEKDGGRGPLKIKVNSYVLDKSHE